MTAEEALLKARQHFEQRYPQYDWEKPYRQLLEMIREQDSERAETPE